MSCILATALLFTTSCTKPGDESIAPNAGSPGSNTGDTGPQYRVAVSTIAGKVNDHGTAEDGNGAEVRFWNPGKMVFDHRNNVLYIADGTTIRSIDQQNNVRTYMILGAISTYSEILDIDLAPGDAGGTLYFITKENDLCKIEPNGNSFRLTKLADRVYGGNAIGTLNSADHFDGPNGLATGRNGEIYFFNTSWNTMRKVTLSSPVAGTVELFAGKPVTTRSGNAWPFSDGRGETATFAGSVPDIASDENGNIYVADFRNDLVRMVTPAGMVSSLFQFKNGGGIDKDGPVSVVEANRVTQVAATRDGSSVFFTTYHDGGNSSPALRVVRPGKEVTTIAGDGKAYGDGVGKDAAFGTISGIAATPDGKTVFIAESGKKVIRKVVIQ